MAKNLKLSKKEAPPNPNSGVALMTTTANNAQLYKSFKQKEADIIQKSGVPLARAYYLLDHKVDHHKHNHLIIYLIILKCCSKSLTR